MNLLNLFDSKSFVFGKLLKILVRVFFALTAVACQHMGFRVPAAADSKKVICASDKRRSLRGDLFVPPADGE